MTKSRPKHERILAIAPSTRGFGFGLLEGSGTLVDWGVKCVRGNKNAQCLLKVQALLTHYTPQLVVIEDVKSKGARRGKRVCELLGRIADLVSEKGIQVMTYSREKLRTALADKGSTTKDGIAAIVAATFPDELGAYLPPERRAWLSEHYNMAIFDAVSFLLMARSDSGVVNE